MLKYTRLKEKKLLIKRYYVSLYLVLRNRKEVLMFSEANWLVLPV